MRRKDGGSPTQQQAESPQSQSKRRWLVLGSVLTSRIIYTINWFNIAPLLGTTGLIAVALNLNLPAQGLLTSSFLLGAGIFQIPAGIVSGRWGPKNTSQLGMLILSLSGIGEGLSPNFPLLFTSRFTLGIGAALFFAPAIGILTPLFKPEEEGFVLGLYNSCFNIGGAIGLFGWVIVTDLLGWRDGLVLGGAIGIISVAIGQIVIPRDKPVERAQRRSMGPVFKNWNVWLIGFGVLGLWGAIFSSSSFLEAYTKDTFAVSPYVSGLMASLIMFASIFGGPIGGRLSDRYRMRKIFILVPGIIVSVGIVLFGISQPIELWFLIPLVGFMDSIVFSTMYASMSQYPEIGHDYAPLGISIINSVQILGSYPIPIIFTFLVSTYGNNYSPGWFFMGGVSLILMMLIFWIKEPFRASANKSS
jgi:MFS family permease